MSSYINNTKIRASMKSSGGVSILGDLASFLTPVLIFSEVSLGGRLFLPEILALIFLPILIMIRGKDIWEIKPFLALVLLWLIGLVVSDLIGHTTFEDYSRGWAKVIFFAINFCSIYLLLDRREKRWALFGYGLAIGMLIDYVVSPSDYAVAYPWKFGIGTSITYLAILSSIKPLAPKSLIPAVVLISMAILNVYLGFRSLGLICGLTGIFLLMARYKKQSHKRYGWTLRGVILLIVFCLGMFAVVEVYNYSASTGLLGESQQQKYISQSAGKWGVLLGGRSELLASGQAIIDSPFIGYGSWAKSPYYADLLSIRRMELGYETTGTYQEDTIPTHSYLFGSWVEAGFLGCLLWFTVLRVIHKVLSAVFLSNFRLNSWAIFCAFMLAWDTLFSPLGAQQRLIAAFQLAIIVSAFLDYKRINSTRLRATS